MPVTVLAVAAAIAAFALAFGLGWAWRRSGLPLALATRRFLAPPAAPEPDQLQAGLRCGLAVQHPLPFTSYNADQGVFVFVQALGQYRPDLYVSKPVFTDAAVILRGSYYNRKTPGSAGEAGQV